MAEMKRMKWNGEKKNLKLKFKKVNQQHKLITNYIFTAKRQWWRWEDCKTKASFACLLMYVFFGIEQKKS